MKSWTRDDLVLFYYRELGESQSRELTIAIANSAQLKQEYKQICNVLDSAVSAEIPELSENLNQRIMTNIYEQQVRTTPVAKAHSKRGILSSLRNHLTEIFFTDQWRYCATASIAIAVVMAGVFYMGRISVESESIVIEQAGAPEVGAQYAFDDQASHRILLTSVSSHLESGGRLLTQVSNGAEGAEVDLPAREQMLEQMIAFNRLYRRAAERSSDGTLVSVLQQMENVLLELYHADDAVNDAGLKGIRSRLDNSDLLFKLKVTNKKISQEII